MYLTLPFCPESPKYILIIQGKDVNAQKALTWLRGTIEIHDELDDIRGKKTYSVRFSCCFNKI